MAGLTLPERVAQIYYTYGLFCSSYPIVAIIFALSVALLCCFPLLNSWGNIPTVVNLPWHMDSVQHAPQPDCTSNTCFQDIPLHLNTLLNETQLRPYIWAKDKPLFYVQQIIMKIGVSPWNNNLKMWDAFRAPIQEAFRLLETIRNHEDPETKSTLPQYCYQIEAIKQRSRDPNTEQVLPEYSCLLLSPANIWHQNLQTFMLDAGILSTVYNFQKEKPLSEMAFGMKLRDTGLKRYPFRARPRVLQYAVTIFYQNPEQRFIKSLTTKLKNMYPLFQESYTPINEVTLIYYPGQFNYRELIPFVFICIGLFWYVYYSLRKMECIKSKVGLAFCAVFTIAGNLFMSMGICFYFGFSLSGQDKKVFPYICAMCIIMGLENVLVLTESVTSTDPRLDVKIRLAQGLSKEGWSITKLLLTKIPIITLGFFTFVPVIQELAIFLIVTVISEYFTQMMFFATILGIDVCRKECFNDQNNKLHLRDYFNANRNGPYGVNYSDENNFSPQRMKKSKSHPRLNGLAQNSPTDVVANVNGSPGHQEKKVPKRIRLVNMWAKTRFFQRVFMLCMIIWIFMIIYDSGVVEYFITNSEQSDSTSEASVKNAQKKEAGLSLYSIFYNNSESLVFPPLPNMETEKSNLEANDTMLKHSPHSRPWSRLSPSHWSRILSQYNESMSGRYAVLLPPLQLSHRVSPELAIGIRHPDEKDPPPLHWKALAAALDPIDMISDFELIENKNQQHQWGQGSDLPIYPTTPMEILLLAILCAISVAVIAYMMVVLYRCVCSRHYAEWRASWNEEDEYKKNIARQPALQLVMEAMPLVVEGHIQEVECIVTDGERVVSSCLQGNIKVWDSQNAELLTDIDRTEFFKLQNKLKETDDTIRRDLRSASFTSPHNELDKLRSQPVLVSSYPSAPLSTNEEADTSNSSVQNQTQKVIDNTEENEVSSRQTDLLFSANGHNLRNRNKSGFVTYNAKPTRNGTTDPVSNSNWKGSATKESPIWCMDFSNDLIILGCADGRLEFWEASTGNLMCIWRSSSHPRSAVGITHVRALAGAGRVCAATLGGSLTLLRLDAISPSSGTHVDWRFSNAQRKTATHKRTGSAGSVQNLHVDENPQGRRTIGRHMSHPQTGDEEMVCVRIAHCWPHQKPITEMHSEGERILTGGQDHILKVFSSRELKPLFTLHGHSGPVTSCFIDHATPTIAGSGSQDGLLCVWDLHTGACLYSKQAHDGAVTSLAYTASYVVSAGADEKLCIWDRFQGHMLNSIHIGLNYTSRMLPLTHTMLVMGDRGGLTVYDLSSGIIIRRVLLEQTDRSVFVRQILPLKDAIVCDYENQLRIVRFPLVSRQSSTKCD